MELTISCNTSMLGDDLWADILCRLSEKELVECKFVCKSWWLLISELCIPTKQLLPPPLTGLYFPTYLLPPDSQLLIGACTATTHRSRIHIFFHKLHNSHRHVRLQFTSLETLDNSNANTTMDHPLYFDHNLRRSIICQMDMDKEPPYHENEFLDSCNGLLLFIAPTECRYFVCNPCTSEFVPIPKAHCHLNRFYAALAFDPSESPYYKVVCFALSESKQDPVLDIFSSDSGQWIRFPLVDLLDSHVCNSSWLRHSIYFGGSLYRLSESGHLLQFHLTKKFTARAIDLPSTPDSVPRKSMGCIGLSMGRLYLAKNDVFDLAVWLLDGTPDSKEEWTFMYSVDRPFIAQELESIHGELTSGQVIWWFQPCGFHPNDDNVIFVMTAYWIVSYDHFKRRLKVLATTRDRTVVMPRFSFPSFTYSRLLISLKHLDKIPCKLDPSEKMLSDKMKVLMLEEEEPEEEEGIDRYSSNECTTNEM